MRHVWLLAELNHRGHVPSRRIEFEQRSGIQRASPRRRPPQPSGSVFDQSSIRGKAHSLVSSEFEYRAKLTRFWIERENGAAAASSARRRHSPEDPAVIQSHAAGITAFHFPFVLKTARTVTSIYEVCVQVFTVKKAGEKVAAATARAVFKLSGAILSATYRVRSDRSQDRYHDQETDLPRDDLG